MNSSCCSVINRLDQFPSHSWRFWYETGSRPSSNSLFFVCESVDKPCSPWRGWSRLQKSLKMPACSNYYSTHSTCHSFVGLRLILFFFPFFSLGMPAIQTSVLSSCTTWRLGGSHPPSGPLADIFKNATGQRNGISKKINQPLLEVTPWTSWIM